MAEDNSTDYQKFSELISDDAHFDNLAKFAKNVYVAWLDALILDRPRTQKTVRVDTYCAGIYEKSGEATKALKVLAEVLAIWPEGVAFRAFFRVCRKTHRLDLADDLFSKNTGTLMESRDFNVLYELVYYFSQRNDQINLQTILGKIYQHHSNSLPILQTLKNFYIQFGVLDELDELDKITGQIDALSSKGKPDDNQYTDQVKESGKTLAANFLAMRTKVEHQDQLLAMSDLARGISHELGQPITNIRYTIQFYKKLLEKNPSKEGVLQVFDSILEETERMGALIQRLSPLTSRQSVNEHFNIIERIQKRIQLEGPRLKDHSIDVDVSPVDPVLIHGDPVRFDQLISNLLLNAIDALGECQRVGNNKITVEIMDQPHSVQIFFADNGSGIPEKFRKKIFEPFFTSKAPGKGEGLGLFIVWNLLTMQGGRIVIDDSFQNGTRFILTIPKNNEIEKGVN